MEHKLWINGEWTGSQDGGQMDIENPATGQKIAEVVNGNFLKVPTTVTDTHICGELRHFSGYTMIED